MTRVRASPPYPKKARTRSLIVSQLIRFVPTEAQTVFALAAIHGHQELARAALKRMGESLEIVGNVDGASRSTGHLTGQACGLVDLPQALSVRIPPHALYQLIRVQQIAFFTDHATPIRERWAKAVKRFYVRTALLQLHARANSCCSLYRLFLLSLSPRSGARTRRTLSCPSRSRQERLDSLTFPPPTLPIYRAT